MKTLLVAVPEATIAKNFLRGTFWQYLKALEDTRIILACIKDKAPEYEKEFGGGNVLVVPLAPIREGWRSRALQYIARNAHKTGTVMMNQMRHRVDGGSLLDLAPKRLLWHIFGRARWVKRLVRSLETRIAPEPEVRDLFETYLPDVFFTAHIMNASFDIPLLREANRRGVRTVGMPRGWDNFTAHGIVRVLPRVLLLQDEFLKENGVRYQYISENIMHIVGFPQNDWYTRNDLIAKREDFCARLGIAPEKRLILFGALGDYLVPSEWEVAEIFEELAESGRIPEDLVMIYRAHPTFDSQPEKMKSFKRVIHDRGAIYSTGEIRSWEMGVAEVAHFMSSIEHSEMVITTGSTCAIDAIALGKPAISTAMQKRPINYWLSAERFRYHFTHYQELLASGGVRAADTPDELASAIRRYLDDPSADAEGRRRTRDHFIEPLDGKAGERVVAVLQSELRST